MTKFNPDIHHRRSIRLKNWDYKKAALYFVTICVNNRENFFGEIKDGKMVANDAGLMIEKNWIDIFKRFKNTRLNKYVIMPNHFYAIIQIVGVPLVGTLKEMGQFKEKGQPQGIAPTDCQTNGATVGDIVGAFKSLSTNEYIRGVKQLNWQPFNKKLWQRNYYEHIIRDEKDFNRISEYIENNPLKWEFDSLYPDNFEKEIKS